MIYNYLICCHAASDNWVQGNVIIVDDILVVFNKLLSKLFYQVEKLFHPNVEPINSHRWNMAFTRFKPCNSPNVLNIYCDIKN